VRNTIFSNATENELASLPRYLLAAGSFDADLREHCLSRLQEEARHSVPRAGFDALEGQIQAVSLSLLELIAPLFSG